MHIFNGFKLWYWRRLLRVPYTARRSSQSILKEINPEFHWKDWCWNWSSNSLATWREESWLTGKYPDAQKDWGQEEKGAAEDEIVGWHHRLNGHEFEWSQGVGDGQGGLACCSPCCHKESGTMSDWTTATIQPHIKEYLYHARCCEKVQNCIHCWQVAYNIIESIRNMFVHGQ